MCFRTLPAVIVALVAFGTGGPDARSEDKQPKQAKVPEKVVKHLGKKAVAILSGATKVETFRLQKEQVAKGGKDTIGFDGQQWPIKAKGKELDAKFAAEVRDLLFDEATCQFSGAGGARGWVAFRLWKEKESVTVVIDFEGHHLYLATRDAEGKQVGDQVVGGFLFDAKGDFDKGVLFGRVKALALKAFPDDAALKALGE
jgi:hypothetical protein